VSKTLKIALIGEALLANIYLPLTNGIFLVYLASLGYDIKSISYIIAAVLIGFISFLILTALLIDISALSSEVKTALVSGLSTGNRLIHSDFRGPVLLRRLCKGVPN